MSAQTQSRRQDNQAVKVLLAMATFASAAVAIASVLLWDDLTSAALFGLPLWPSRPKISPGAVWGEA